MTVQYLITKDSVNVWCNRIAMGEFGVEDEISSFYPIYNIDKLSGILKGEIKIDEL